MKQIDNTYELQVVKMGGLVLDMVVLDENPWFSASRLAHVLGVRDSGNVLRLVDKDETQKVKVRTGGGIQQVSVISERGLFMLMINSRSSIAEGFKRWAFREYIPGAVRLHKLLQDAKRLGVSFDFSEDQWEWLKLHPYMLDILPLAAAGYNTVEISTMLGYNTHSITAQKQIEKLRSLGFLPERVTPRMKQLEQRIKMEVASRRPEPVH
jgi:hypothetical protein